MRIDPMYNEEGSVESEDFQLSVIFQIKFG
jgi:hypothetical protein